MSYNTIKLKKYQDIIEEYTATAVAITPGDLLEVTSAGLVQAHSVEGGVILPIIALEDELQGNGIDDDYAASDKIQCWVAQAGEMAYLNVAEGEDVSTGDKLISAGDGTVKVYTGDAASDEEYPQSIVGIADDDLDMTDSDDAEIGRVAVRIM
jgi:hypothetical protein